MHVSFAFRVTLLRPIIAPSSRHRRADVARAAGIDAVWL
jgi:hypothetical protein